MIKIPGREWEEQYMPYAIFDENDKIIGFVDNTPESAKRAAKEHLLSCKKFAGIENYDYYDEIIKKLKL